MGYQQTVGLPGPQTERPVVERSIFATNKGQRFSPGGAIIKGSVSRDPGNTSYEFVLRAGLLMGRRSSDNKYAPSVLGYVNETIDGSETALTLDSTATGTEISRRIGASGTVNITGMSNCSNTVYATTPRTIAVAYSAVAAGVLTITAMGTSAVWTLDIAAGADAGTFNLRVITPAGVTYVTTGHAFNVATATLQTALQALIPDTGVGITVTGTAGTQYVITFNRDTCPGDYTVEVYGDSVIDSPVWEGGVVATKTTAGVDGTFASGALVQPNDGSETIRTFIPDGTGERVADADLNSVDVPWGAVPIAGHVITDQIINIAASGGLRTWVKSQLKANGGLFTFDDDFIG